MKIDLKQLLVLLKLKTTRVPSGREGSIFLYRDWQWLVISVIVLSFGAIGFGLYMLYTVSSAKFSETDIPSSMQTLSRAKLQEVITIYIAKQTEYDSRKNSKPDVPSL